MNTKQAIRRTEENVSGNPALIALLPIVFEAITNILGACRKEQDAVAGMQSATDAQKARVMAEARRRLRAQGKTVRPADLRAAVESACETGKTATGPERVAFLHNAYKAGDLV